MSDLNPSFIVGQRSQVYVYQNGSKYVLDKSLPLLTYYPIDHKEVKDLNFIDIPKKTTKINLYEYIKNYYNELDLEQVSHFAFPKITSFEFKTKFMFDTQLTYNYSFDVLFFDIETASTNGEFAGVNNPTAFVAMIQMRHIKNYSNDRETIDYLFILEKY